MNAGLWLVICLTAGLVGVLWWLLTDWRKEARRATAAGRAAQAALADMGKHNVPASEEHTDPKFVEARELLPVGEEPCKRSRRIPVQDLLARARNEGAALRLNWQPDDEQRARSGDGGTDPGDFPTAVLPVIPTSQPQPPQVYLANQRLDQPKNRSEDWKQI